MGQERQLATALTPSGTAVPAVPSGVSPANALAGRDARRGRRDTRATIPGLGCPFPPPPLRGSIPQRLLPTRLFQHPRYYRIAHEQPPAQAAAIILHHRHHRPLID